MKIFILVLLFFSLKANAQEAQYELKGTLATNTKTDKKVDFSGVKLMEKRLVLIVIMHIQNRFQRKGFLES